MSQDNPTSWGVVNDIQRMCVNDGPGYRTTEIGRAHV